MRKIAVFLMIVVACGGTGGDEVATTAAQSTSSTVALATTTTLDPVEARSAVWSIINASVSNLDLAAAGSSEEGLLKFIRQSDAVVELIEGMRSGPVGWGDCEDAASSIEDAMIFLQEGQALALEGITAADAETMTDGATLIGLGADKLTEARLLRDICLS